MGRNVLVITDMSFAGSGYFTISIPVLTGLAGLGYSIRVLGVGYRGEEHTYPFSIIPAASVSDAMHQATNLNTIMATDAIIVALDIPQHMALHSSMKQLADRYIAITPLENGPLMMSWAASLINMKAVFFISELGESEAKKVGLTNAHHLTIGIDNALWRLPIGDEKKNLKKGLGIDEDTFVVLTVAENQERKNLSAALGAIAELKKINPTLKIKHILVTRAHTPIGWNFPDLANSLGLQNELVMFERGLPQKDLWGLYAASDAFLLTSKAEGLGLPILEAMACGVPVVATDTGAIHELLSDGRGYLVRPEYSFIDVWGNSKRDMINIKEAAISLNKIANGTADWKSATRDARKYIEGRTWDVATKQLYDAIEEMANENSKNEKQ